MASVVCKFPSATSLVANRQSLQTPCSRTALCTPCYQPLKCRAGDDAKAREHADGASKLVHSWLRTGAVAVLSAAVLSAGPMPVGAVLNKLEADTRGEFGIGSAAQYGSADLKNTKHSNENFRRANFTSADIRYADFSGSVFTGAYFEKAVAAGTNFEGADLTDTLMDRMVLNDANLKDAVLVRAVLTRSDLGGANIEGADFSDALLDLPQKQALCKYASGVNSTTGMDTKKSLGCSTYKRNAYGSPSAPELSGPAEKLLSRDGFCDESTGKCEAGALKK